MRTGSRRALFRDPPPLPPGSPDFACPETRDWYFDTKRRAEARMMQFDGCPPERRKIEAAVGVPELAEMFVRQGIYDSEIAEREYRRMAAPRVQWAPAPVRSFAAPADVTRRPRKARELRYELDE